MNDHHAAHGVHQRIMTGISHDLDAAVFYTVGNFGGGINHFAVNFQRQHRRDGIIRVMPEQVVEMHAKCGAWNAGRIVRRSGRFGFGLTEANEAAKGQYGSN